MNAPESGIVNLPCLPSPRQDPAAGDLPLVPCLCPTYRRPPRLLASAIARFERQDYPADRRRLFVLDDAGELEPVCGAKWSIATTNRRYPTLPAKYNVLFNIVHSARATPELWEAEIFVVWEDDDIYLPWHVSSIVGALYAPIAPRYKHGRAWAHPSRVWSLYGGRLHQEPAGGRFHAALAVRWTTLTRIHGWPDTPRGDFDQQLMARLRREYGPPADPCEAAPPSYVFRWASTNSYHGQAWMRSPADIDWYRNAPTRIPSQGTAIRITPALDVETEALICRPEPVG